MTNQVKWKSFVITALIGLGMVLTSCLNNDLDIPPQQPAAYVTVYQAATGAPSLDIFADANRITQQSLRYSEMLPYNPFYLGKRKFSFFQTNSVNAILEKEFTLEMDSVYTMFIVDESPNIDAILLRDAWAEPTSDKAQLRFVHLSQDAGDVEVEISDMNEPFADGAEFKSFTPFIKLDDDTYTITVKSKNSGEVLVTARNLQLRGNRIFTLVLRGSEASTDPDKKLNLQLITNFINY